MSKLLDVVYAAALAYGGYRGMLTKWSGGVSALLVLVAPGKLKSLISLVLTAALSRKWGVLGSSHHTVVPAVVTAVMTFVYAFHKKSLKSTKMAVMKEDPSVSYESKLVESDVKGWGYRSVKFVQARAGPTDPHCSAFAAYLRAARCSRAQLGAPLICVAACLGGREYNQAGR